MRSWSGRRRVVLGMIGAFAATACLGPSDAQPTPPAASPSPDASPSPASGASGPVQEPGPIATSVRIEPAAGAAAPTVPVPARVGSSSPNAGPSPGPAALASPAPAIASPAPAITSPTALASPAALASPTPARIVLARPGSIALVRDGRIVVVDPASQSPPRTLVADLDSAAPRWSPNGQAVLVTAGRAAAGNLDLVSADGRARRRLTHDLGEERAAAWSPLASALAFVRIAGDAGADAVWVHDLGSDRQTKVADGSDPAWAPDGRTLAYATPDLSDERGPRANGIWAVDATGSGGRAMLAARDVPADLLRRVGLPMAAQPVRLRSPVWSPDGIWLAAVADGRTSFVVVFDRTGGQARALAPLFEGRLARLRWSPDGSRIAVEQRPATGVDVVMIVDLASGRERTVGGPEAGHHATDATWSPDGQRIALVARKIAVGPDDTRSATLRALTAAGEPVADLLEGADLRDPDWGPAPP